MKFFTIRICPCWIGFWKKNSVRKQFYENFGLEFLWSICCGPVAELGLNLGVIWAQVQMNLRQRALKGEQIRVDLRLKRFFYGVWRSNSGTFCIGVNKNWTEIEGFKRIEGKHNRKQGIWCSVWVDLPMAQPFHFMLFLCYLELLQFI